MLLFFFLALFMWKFGHILDKLPLQQRPSPPSRFFAAAFSNRHSCALCFFSSDNGSQGCRKMDGKQISKMNERGFRARAGILAYSFSVRYVYIPDIYLTICMYVYFLPLLSYLDFYRLSSGCHDQSQRKLFQSSCGERQDEDIENPPVHHGHRGRVAVGIRRQPPRLCGLQRPYSWESLWPHVQGTSVFSPNKTKVNQSQLWGRFDLTWLYVCVCVQKNGSNDGEMVFHTGVEDYKDYGRIQTWKGERLALFFSRCEGTWLANHRDLKRSPKIVGHVPIWSEYNGISVGLNSRPLSLLTLA